MDMARTTSGLLEFGGLAFGNPRSEFIGGGKVAVPQAGVFLLIADLLEDVGKKVLGVLVARLGLHELVHDFLGEQIFALVMQLRGRAR